VAYHPLDTIVAVASPPGGAARGVVRLSGPRVVECIEQFFTVASAPEETGSSSEGNERSFDCLARPTAMSGRLSVAGLHSPLPAELYFWPGKRSYTGQPVAEFHTVGCMPLLDAILRAACGAGARLAQPGEFTLRAFLAGRIDLTQAEAVLGVIDAGSSSQLDVALGQLAGGLSGPLDELRDLLLDLLGHLEAGLDFADEDLPFVTAEELSRQLRGAHERANRLAAQLQSRRREETRIRIALVGRPNAGKSSLFNALARKAGAIVSHRPGTTRDYLSAEVEWDGLRFELIDTAGLEPCLRTDSMGNVDSPGAAAQTVARQQVARANLRIACLDATEAADGGDLSNGLLYEEHTFAASSDVIDIRVLTKIDLIGRGASVGDGPVPLAVSSVTGEGLERLRSHLCDRIRELEAVSDNAVASTAARCSESLTAATEALEHAAGLVETGGGEELVAAEIRVALEAIGRVAGTVCTDDVLDRVFSRFCIGK
jgi:tRNA modification GTPase